MSALDNAIAKLESRFAPLSSRLEAMLETLSPRDRSLLLMLFSAGLLVIMGGGGWFLRSTLNDLESQLNEGRSTLAFIQGEAAEYDLAQGRVEEIEDELRKHQSTDLSTFMERAAKTAKVDDRLKSVRETSVTTLGSLEQKNYSVDVSRVTLQELLDFLYEVEGTGYPLKILSTNIKTTKVADAQLYNVKLDVAAFRLSEEEG